LRLWSLHPSLLDRAGLVALWREALLAQHVLLGRTKGYRHHPQLDRFRQAPAGAAISTYLWSVHEEAIHRGYRFDDSKIATKSDGTVITVTRGQLLYELEHLKSKLRRRDPVRLRSLPGQRTIFPHPMFTVIPGPIEPWERVKS